MDPKQLMYTLMGYHLQADVKHDFGASVPGLYNIHGSDAYTKAGARSVDEDAAVSFFLDGPGGVIIKDLAARKSGQIIFTVPEKTASFQNWKAPVLYQAGNDKIGMIQDAGEFITLQLGCKNVITFGSVLDPAGKPIRQNQFPIWFEPSSNIAQIPLAPFGFDRTEVNAVEIKDLTAGTLKAGFLLGNGTKIDAVAMIAGEPTKPKPINNTNVGTAGFFTSINKAENIGVELSIAGYDQPTIKNIVSNYGKYFFIGKTLGDATLVASGIPSFLANDLVGQTPNPFNGTNGVPGTWRSWFDVTNVVTGPTILALKTGDRLNWLRAIIMNLATIYEDQAKGARKTKQYKFFPGTGDPLEVRKAILGDFDTMMTETATRYATLQQNIRNEFFKDRVLRTEKLVFAPGGQRIIAENARNPAPVLLASILLANISNALLVMGPGNTITGGICKNLTDWIALRKQKASEITTNEALQAYYADTLMKINACSPQANSLFIQKGKQEPYVTMKLIVTNVPVGAVKSTDGWPLVESSDISLRNALVALSKAVGTGTEADYNRLISGTDIYNRFLSKFIVQAPSVDAPLNTESLNEFVGEVAGGDDIAQGGGGQMGGAYLSVKFINMGTPGDADEIRKVLELFPRMNDFIQYMNGKGVTDPQYLFLSVYDVIRRRNTDRILDPFLAEELMLEFLDFVGFYRGTPYINIPQANPAVFSQDYVYSDRKYPSSTATILFNAYTYHVNARNALELTGDLPNQSESDFQTIETTFLQMLQYKVARGTSVERVQFERFEEAPRPRDLYRGFAGRRPLYSKRATSSAE